NRKPEVRITYPKGVKVTEQDRKPGKTVSYDLVPIAIVVLFMVYIATSGRSREPKDDQPMRCA
ncbi:MAG: hypothetical protein ACR2QJ_10695, partial [Geminicoccaceae bacterium]